MDNQHKQIKGYRDLSQDEIDQMNEVKELGIKIGEVVDKVQALPKTDQRWASIGKTDLQKGLMALIRSIGEWVSVEDRLPKIGQQVLIFIYDGLKRFECGSLYEFSDGPKWTASGVGVLKDSPTHWMPLPNPPQTEGGEK